MNTSHTYTVRRAAAALLAMMVLLSLSGGLAMGMGTPQQQAVSITLHYMLDGAAMTQPAEPLPYPGYESSFWLYIGPEAQADPNATLDVSDVSGRFQYGFSLQPGTPASTLYQYNADGALSGQYLPFYPLGPNSETLNEYEYRLYISLSAPVYQPPETPVQPADITILYVDTGNNQLAVETRTLPPGGNTVQPDASRVDAGFTLLPPYDYQVNVGEYGADRPTVTFTYEAPPVVTAPPVQPADVTILYVDTDNNQLAMETRTLQPGGNTVHPDASRVPDGYTLQAPYDYQVNVGEYGADRPTVTFTYEAPPVVTAPPVQPADITILYVDTDNNQLAVETRTLQPGGNAVYPDASRVPDGFTLLPPYEYQVNVSELGADRPTVTFTYEAPPVQPVDITVYYRDEQGNRVADTQVIKLGAGSHSLVPSPVNLLPGHELIGPQSGQVEVGPDGASPEELVFIYRLIPPVSRQVDVVVSYVDEAGQRVASDTVFTAGEGKHSVPAAPRDLKEGYALMPGEDAAKYVTITQNTATPASLQFVYRMAESATATPPPVLKAPLVTITYKTETGLVLYTTTVPCKQGDQTEISVELNRIDSAVYQLVNEPTHIITVDAAGNPSQRDVVFIFRDITVKTANITIHYRDNQGNTLSPSQKQTIQEGTNLITATPDSLPEGYLLIGSSTVEVVLSPSGVPSQDTVIFLYEKPITPSPSPTITPEATSIPFDVTPMDRYAVSTGDSINYRSSPDTAPKDNILGQVSRKDVLHVQGMVTNHKNEKWYLIELSGQQAFISANFTRLWEFNEAAAYFGWTPTPSPEPLPSSDPFSDGEIIDRWAEVTDSKGVNMRGKASTSSKKLDTLSAGTRFWVYTQQTVGEDLWYSVMANGTKGFLMAKYTRLYSQQESAQYQVTLASPMPYAATPTPTAPPASDAPPTQTPDPTKAPDSSLAPVAYIGPALTIRQTALRTGVSVQDEQIMEMLEVNTLVHVTSQTWVGQEGWSLVMVMADKQAGYVPNASLRYIDESEAAYHLAKLQPQNSPTATPTRQPDQRTGYSITRGENVPLRSFPDTNAQIATLLPEGAVVNVRGQEYTAGTTWDVVQYAEYFGYVRSDQLRIFNQSEVENYLNSLRTPTPLPVYTPEPVTLNSPSSYGYVSGDRVILRNEPSIKAKELKLMNKYSFALVYGSTVQSDGTWYRINQDGTVGHVRGDLFTVLSMGELSNFLQSPEYLNANAVTIPASGNYQQQSQITPLESFNTTVWQNPALISASYEPFNPLGTPTPPVEAILTPSPSPSPSPSPTLMTVEGFEEPPPEKKDSGFPTGLLTIGLIMLLGGGGYYAYYLYHQNQKRAAARAAQRRAQAARQAGQPQTRPAGQQPSPYIPPRPGAQGTAQYRPQGTPPQGGQPSPSAPPAQGTAQYRPQGGQTGMTPPAQGTAQYRPQGGQPGMTPPTQGTTQYRPQGTPPQGGQPGAVPPGYRASAPGDSQPRTEQPRRRRSDRHNNT